MTITKVALLGVYLAGWLFTYRHAYARFDRALRSEMGEDLGELDRATVAAVCMVLCLGWPLVLVGYGVWCFLTPVSIGSRTGNRSGNKAGSESKEKS